MFPHEHEAQIATPIRNRRTGPPRFA